MCLLRIQHHQLSVSQEWSFTLLLFISMLFRSKQSHMPTDLNFSWVLYTVLEVSCALKLKTILKLKKSMILTLELLENCFKATRLMNKKRLSKKTCLKLTLHTSKTKMDSFVFYLCLSKLWPNQSRKTRIWELLYLLILFIITSNMDLQNLNKLTLTMLGRKRVLKSSITCSILIFALFSSSIFYNLALQTLY